MNWGCVSNSFPPFPPLFLQWFSYLHFSLENSDVDVCRKPKQRIFMSDEKNSKIRFCFLLPHITHQKERKCHKKKITNCGRQRPSFMLAHFGGSITKTRALIVFVYLFLLLCKQSFYCSLQWQIGSNNDNRSWQGLHKISYTFTENKAVHCDTVLMNVFFKKNQNNFNEKSLLFILTIHV